MNAIQVPRNDAMPRFAANLSMMYQEHAFLERFGAAAKDGFEAVEVQFPYTYPAAELRARLTEHGLTQALFNGPPGNSDAGERGLASVPGREDEFRRGVGNALDYARVLGNECVHLMAGLIRPGEERARQRETYVRNLDYAAKEAAAAGVTIVIEPINGRDIPGYFLNRQDEAHAICAEVGAPNLKVQMDFYHCQIVEGDLAMKFRQYIAGIGHVQVAGVPGRHEPDSGEINYPYLFELMDELGYSGWVGCEYRPRGGTSAGLGWLRNWLNGRP
jgi:2-dehydrotetronate isomerase